LKKKNPARGFSFVWRKSDQENPTAMLSGFSFLKLDNFIVYWFSVYMKKILLCFAVVAFSMPTVSFAQSSTSVQDLMQMVIKLQAQLTELQLQKNAINADEEVSEEWKFNYSKSNLKLGTGKEDVSYSEKDNVKRYLVQNNRLYEDGKWTKNTDADEYKMWNIFAKIAGDDFVDAYLARYATYRIADTGTLGFVRVLDAEEPSWGLAVNANASDFSNAKWTRDLVGVLIHEYAHVLTLNGDQINHKKKKEAFCKGNYLSNKGCAEKKSYLNNYVDRFWDEKDFSIKAPAREKYFKEHPDEFVTEYGLKSPEEDIAESFTQFILYEKPTGTKKKDLKVAFFYEYPEFVEMRTRIRGEIQQYFVK
jgi:hypothetical protein